MGRPGRVGRPGPHRRDGRSGALNEELDRARRGRAEETDRLLRDSFAAVAGDVETGLALAAIGGYGRSQLSPHSDVDVVLVHSDHLDPADVDARAADLWGRLWEANVPLDPAVRSLDEMERLAAADHRVAIGVVDARCVAGDAAAVVAMRSTVMAGWRRDARRQLAAVRTDRDARLERSGQLAYEAVPDLKASGGGLRDAVLLRAIAATWLVDVPAREVAQLTADLLDVRDLLHEVAGKRTDKLVPELVPDIAARLDLSPTDLDVHVRDVGRRLDHLTARAWRRLDETDRNPYRSIGSRGPVIERIVSGVGVLDGEIVLTADATPRTDPELLFRVAATAARRNLPINQASLDRMAREISWPEGPLPATTHRWLIDLLSAGRRLVPVWLQLDFAGLVDPFFPEWAGIRLRGSSSPIHRFTVDRHSLEAVVNADELNRDVARPDVLAVACLLHDIGKGAPGDHSEVGEPMAEAVARRWGFGDHDAETIGWLVRRHLLLPTIATRRDIEDPVTVTNVAEFVPDEDALDLLSALTACDARATSASAWSDWRRSLVEGLAGKVRARLRGTTPPPSDDYAGWPAHVPLPDLTVPDADLRLTATAHHDGSLVTIVVPDRQGVLADLAGALTVAGLDIRSCRSITADDVAASLWEVTRAPIDATALAERIRPVLQGRQDLAQRLAYRLERDEYEPRIAVLDTHEQSATLLQVRTLDRRGLVWTVCRTISALGHHIRSAHLSTYGDEARDVFYVTDDDGAALDDDAAQVLRTAVSDALA
ncbi:[protein-PII] uridylyltransferase [Aeromicrobium tamlense]|uniref:Bifunctional uridylyltransferase/uridylyl-removing enzyme n=1 Tax=Aeromicrobium tamlense TaxID=375541 RepID=A0A8I0FX76_9ACTN|nr:[protein-PII] uridylyltransferase [Aeromicrobium tamlense]MBD1270595.1 [protein-PII] uridylyltransferase [Aeromicrobium tamlense]MBD1271273.1 [protein-PII] uridylyltransferase [Aeromicrobium tamlense]